MRSESDSPSDATSDKMQCKMSCYTISSCQKGELCSWVDTSFMGVAEQGQFPVAMLHSVMMTHHSNTFETELRVEANMHTFPKTHLFWPHRFAKPLKVSWKWASEQMCLFIWLQKKSWVVWTLQWVLVFNPFKLNFSQWLTIIWAVSAWLRCMTAVFKSLMRFKCVLYSEFNCSHFICLSVHHSAPINCFKSFHLIWSCHKYEVIKADLYVLANM